MMETATDEALDAEDIAAINEAEAQIERGEGIDLATLRTEMSKRFGNRDESQGPGGGHE
jgi:hypothetical protein